MDGSGRTWTIFDGFEVPSRKLTWSSLADLIELGQTHARRQCAELPDLLAEWNRQLTYLGEDPSHLDWWAFRPLRTGREEDWSDWLHHFLATSTTGHLAYQLFNRCGFERAEQCVQPIVTREEVGEHRRADLVIRWSNGAHSQLEVKVGDRHLEKTYDTALELEKKHETCWTHYILLPREDEWRWRAIKDHDKLVVHAMTWDEVAIALRRSLRRRSESQHWLVWAHGFCGAIEQKLIGLPRCLSGQLPHVAMPVGSIGDISRRVRQISIMKQGLEDA